MIASRTKKSISEKMLQDPTFYRRFSDVLQKALDDYHQERITDSEFLARVTQVHDGVLNRTGDPLPEAVRDRPLSGAFYGILLEEVNTLEPPPECGRAFATDAALRMEETVRPKAGIVNWTDNSDLQNQMQTDMEDLLCDLKTQYELELSWDVIDRILEQCLNVTRNQLGKSVGAAEAAE